MIRRILGRLTFLIYVFLCLTGEAFCEADTDRMRFENAFSHSAQILDSALCLQSAYASDYAYNRERIAGFLLKLGFDAESIVQKNYDSTRRTAWPSRWPGAASRMKREKSIRSTQ